MVRLLAELSDTKSYVKLGGFRSQLQASYVSSHTEELWHNETVYPWMTIYTLPHEGWALWRREFSYNANLFEWIEHFGIR